MSTLAIYLGKAFGVFCLLLFGVLLVRPKAGLDAVRSVTGSPGLLLVTGLVTLGGALPVAVTVLG